MTGLGFQWDRAAETYREWCTRTRKLTRTFAAVLLLGCVGATFAASFTVEPTEKPFVFDKTIPEWPSPASFSIDAAPFVTTPFSTGVILSSFPRFHVDGASMTGVEIENEGGGRFALRFYIGLRRGYDMDGTVSYELTSDDQVLAAGQLGPGNLDEREITVLATRIKLKKAGLEGLRARGGTLRVTMSVAEQP